MTKIARTQVPPSALRVARGGGPARGSLAFLACGLVAAALLAACSAGDGRPSDRVESAPESGTGFTVFGDARVGVTFGKDRAKAVALP